MLWWHWLLFDAGLAFFFFFAGLNAGSAAALQKLIKPPPPPAGPTGMHLDPAQLAQLMATMQGGQK